MLGAEEWVGADEGSEEVDEAADESNNDERVVRVLGSAHWRSSMKITSGWSRDATAAMNLMNNCLNLKFNH